MALTSKAVPVVKTQLQKSDTKVTVAKGQQVFDPKDGSHVSQGKSWK